MYLKEGYGKLFADQNSLEQDGFDFDRAVQELFESKNKKQSTGRKRLGGQSQTFT